MEAELLDFDRGLVGPHRSVEPPVAFRCGVVDIAMQSGGVVSVRPVEGGTLNIPVSL
jgi:hypothetical protein